MPTEEQLCAVLTNEFTIGIRNHDYSVQGSVERFLAGSGTPDTIVGNFLYDLKIARCYPTVKPKNKCKQVILRLKKLYY